MALYDPNSNAPLEDDASGATWPERVIALCRAWSDEHTTASAREKAVSQLWLLLNAAISKYIRIHGRKFHTASAEDLQDLAQDKTLDLLRRLEGHLWDPSEASPGQLCSFISTLARNGLIDLLRVTGSKKMEELEAADGADGPEVRIRRRTEDPDAGVHRERFADAVRDCAELLNARTRRIWFLRVLLDMSSKDIALHPDVNMKPPAVDMALSRCRTVIRDCMNEKGFQADDVPTGAFTTIWETFRHEVES